MIDTSCGFGRFLAALWGSPRRGSPAMAQDGSVIPISTSQSTLGTFQLCLKLNLKRTWNQINQIACTVISFSFAIRPCLSHIFSQQLLIPEFSVYPIAGGFFNYFPPPPLSLWSCLILSRYLSFKETCSVSKKKKTKREEMSERRIQEEYKKLGNVR